MGLSFSRALKFCHLRLAKAAFTLDANNFVVTVCVPVCICVCCQVGFLWSALCLDFFRTCQLTQNIAKCVLCSLPEICKIWLSVCFLFFLAYGVEVKIFIKYRASQQYAPAESTQLGTARVSRLRPDLSTIECLNLRSVRWQLVSPFRLRVHCSKMGVSLCSPCFIFIAKWPLPSPIFRWRPFRQHCRTLFGLCVFFPFLAYVCVFLTGVELKFVYAPETMKKTSSITAFMLSIWTGIQNIHFNNLNKMLNIFVYTR